MDEAAAGVVREDYEEEEMRLIDADALVSALNNGRLKEQTGRAVPFNAGVAFALTMVEYAQTIDAVPVVRCKDCIFAEQNVTISHSDSGDYTVTLCLVDTIPKTVDNYYFCAGGESKRKRKDNG